VKRLKGKNNREKDIVKRRVRRWMREETSEATTRLFWTIENSTVSWSVGACKPCNCGQYSAKASHVCFC
jgi:hypothetical protein